MLNEDREKQDTFLGIQKKDVISMSQFVKVNGVQNKEESSDFYSKQNTIQRLLSLGSDSVQRNDREEEKLQKKSENSEETKEPDPLGEIEHKLIRTRSGGVPMSDELLQEM